MSEREPWEPQCPEVSGITGDQCLLAEGHESLHRAHTELWGYQVFYPPIPDPWETDDE